MSLPDDAVPIAPLIERLAHPDRLERVHAAAGLVRLARLGHDVPAALIAALQAEKVKMRKMAAMVLGEVALGASEAVPALVGALQDPDPGVRRRAAVALGQFAGEAATALPALRSALEDPDAGVRSFAATALALITPATGGAQAA